MMILGKIIKIDNMTLFHKRNKGERINHLDLVTICLQTLSDEQRYFSLQINADC